MPDWHTGAWLHNGLCDLVEHDGDLRRVPDPAHVVGAAHRLNKQPDRDWCRECGMGGDAALAGDG